MRLNPDCVRDILLSIEKTTSYHTSWRYTGETISGLEKYTGEEVFYHLRQCDEAGMLLEPYWATRAFQTKDISPKGHEFLANIRDDSVWNKVKETSKKISAYSLKALVSISGNVISNLISGYFGPG